MINYNNLPSPSYVCDLTRLESNLKLLARVKEQSGAKVILALKGFAMWSTFDLVAQRPADCMRRCWPMKR